MEVILAGAVLFVESGVTGGLCQNRRRKGKFEI